MTESHTDEERNTANTRVTIITLQSTFNNCRITKAQLISLPLTDHSTTAQEKQETYQPPPPIVPQSCKETKRSSEAPEGKAMSRRSKEKSDGPRTPRITHWHPQVRAHGLKTDVSAHWAEGSRYLGQTTLQQASSHVKLMEEEDDNPPGTPRD